MNKQLEKKTDQVIDAVYAAKPRVTIEMHRDRFHTISRLKDDSGVYLFNGPQSALRPYSTFMGYRVKLVDMAGVRLRYEFPNGDTFTSEVEL